VNIDYHVEIDRQPLEPVEIPAVHGEVHANVRGSEYYSEEEAANFVGIRTSIDVFHREISQIRPTLCRKILVSGPWPPYNFVETRQPMKNL
jgi:hypothetical protein